MNMLSDAQNNSEDGSFFTQFGRGQTGDTRIATNHYLIGLAYEGLGEKEKAKREFISALKFSFSFLLYHLILHKPIQLDNGW